ncbi:MAG: DNA replication/repair protein RecF [Gammaproteobacteria bacterium]|nr:DNA replication/repair protein RecF [Gammaproteobacteria bacterium]
MPINSLQINDFRNLTALSLQAGSRLNIISGSNGSGKTSLLEAIHYLGMGKSFRTATSSSLVRHSTEKFSIIAQLVTDQERFIPVGVERHINGHTRLRMDENDVTGVAELAYFLPIRIINSHSHVLFESGPLFRRKYLDWGLFYQTDSFLSCWRHFERILKQRNILLKNKKPKSELDVWTEGLIKYGNELNTLRQTYIQTLTPFITQVVNDLLGLADLKLQYYAGWDEEKDYATVLANAYMEELRVGHTLYGPHRADLDVTLDTVSVKHFLSRGQQKLLICAMIVAQGMLLGTQINKGLVFLIDDLPAELDMINQSKLVKLLAGQNTQVFITAIEHKAIFDVISPSIPTKVFHVEHGDLREC